MILEPVDFDVCIFGARFSGRGEDMNRIAGPR
jgi:hypothetical protein